MIKISTAIIPVAGYGSRMLPVTKVVEKCMLPVINRPVIDYVVADCISAGITNIVFVVGEGSDQLQRYYGHNAALENYLINQHKEDYLPLIKPPQGVTFAYVEQAQSGKYGTAVPVALASHFVEDDEQVLVLMGDDFVWNKDGSSELKRLIASVKNNKEASMLGVPVQESQLSKYGVIKASKDGIFEAIVEKPRVGNAPSNLINISKYVVPASLLDYIVESTHYEKSEGEYLITDPINEWVKNGGVMRVQRAVGKYLDGGNPKDWLAANNYIAQHSK